MTTTATIPMLQSLRSRLRHVSETVARMDAAMRAATFGSNTYMRAYQQKRDAVRLGDRVTAVMMRRYGVTL